MGRTFLAPWCSCCTAAQRRGSPTLLLGCSGRVGQALKTARRRQGGRPAAQAITCRPVVPRRLRSQPGPVPRGLADPLGRAEGQARQTERKAVSKFSSAAYVLAHTHPPWCSSFMCPCSQWYVADREAKVRAIQVRGLRSQCAALRVMELRFYFNDYCISLSPPPSIFLRPLGNRDDGSHTCRGIEPLVWGNILCNLRRAKSYSRLL
jgi:hypothetical protein